MELHAVVLALGEFDGRDDVGLGRGERGERDRVLVELDHPDLRLVGGDCELGDELLGKFLDVVVRVPGDGAGLVEDEDDVDASGWTLEAWLRSIDLEKIFSDALLHHFAAGAIAPRDKGKQLTMCACNVNILRVIQHERQGVVRRDVLHAMHHGCLLYTSPSPRDQRGSRLPYSS
mgnify:CR=1 FL=1